MRAFAPAVAFAALLTSLGCDDVQRTDARFSTPERTVSTLLATHGIEDETQEAIQARMAEGAGAFELRDAETWRLCFTDLDEPGGEGMAGYVLGMLAAGRDQLRFETSGEWAYVFPPREGLRVVMRRGDDGAYRIVLHDSVPEEVRQGLLQIEQNARRRRVPTGP